MKIVYMITGSGDSFYCGNCYRDMLYLRAMRKVPGTTTKAIPLYLRPGKSSTDYDFDDKVFFGAISLYLREKVRLFRNMPSFLDKVFNSGPFLSLAARQAGTTRTEGMEELTLNMISGGTAFRANEVDRLVRYLQQEGLPDVIHLSNALVLGLASQLKKRINVKIVCSLLNEDDWIDEMAQPYQRKAWEMIASESGSIDLFVTPSIYYKEMFIKKTGINEDKIDVVPLGFDPVPTQELNHVPGPPAVGYFCRINQMNGFDKLVNAFIELKSGPLLRDLTLHVCGGYTGDDKQFISSQIRKIKEKGFEKSLKIYSEFQGDKKTEFFNNVDVISVPVRKYDGYGLYILEANGAGIPVVQPATGAFPEIIHSTGGGIIYSPDTTSELASALQKVLINNTLRKKLAETGKMKVRSELSLDKMASGLSRSYGRLNIPGRNL
jgi:glycosyltransferase involved in cell wall biosynthesis